MLDTIVNDSNNNNNIWTIDEDEGKRVPKSRVVKQYWFKRGIH